MFTEQNELTYPQDPNPGMIGDLELFKTLLQPHFLFNSLNNLYALSIKRSELTADAIVGLSGLLEKVVSYSRREYISLDRELSLIREYIDLERIWLGDNGFLIDFHVSGETDDFIIPPLVLYTFVENCFKHGIRNAGGNGWLTLRVERKPGFLKFIARNNIANKGGDVKEIHTDDSGVGITAVRELLDKKCKNGYHLKMDESENTFTVRLRIDAITI